MTVQSDRTTTNIFLPILTLRPRLTSSYGRKSPTAAAFEACGSSVGHCAPATSVTSCSLQFLWLDDAPLKVSLHSVFVIKIGTHCVHVGSAVHALWTCLFTDTLSLTHSYMPDDIVGRALHIAHTHNGSHYSPALSSWCCNRWTCCRTNCSWSRIF